MTFQTGPIKAFLGVVAAGGRASVVRQEVTLTRNGTTGETSVADLGDLGLKGYITAIKVRQDDTLDDAEVGRLRVYDDAYVTEGDLYVNEIVGLEGSPTGVSAEIEGAFYYEVEGVSPLRMSMDILVTRGATTTSIKVAVWAVVFG